MKKKHLKKHKYITSSSKFIFFITKYQYNEALALLKNNFPDLDTGIPLNMEIIEKENPQIKKWLPEKKDLAMYEAFLYSLYHDKKDKHTAFNLSYLLAKKFSNEFSSNAKFGLLCWESKFIDMAERYLKIAMQIDPNNSKNLVNFGNVLREKSNIEEAHYLYKKAFELDPKNDAAAVNLAMTYFHMGDTLNYELYIIKALELSPGNIPALISYAQYLLFEKNDKNGFIQIKDKLRQIEKDSQYIYLLEAILKEFEHKDAMYEYDKFLDKCKEKGEIPPIIDAFKITNEYELNKYEKMIEKMKEEKLMPRWQYLYEKAFILFENWKITDAKKCLLESLNEYSNNNEAKINLISIYIMEDDLDNAKKQIELLKEFMEYSPRLKCFSALILIKENKINEAKILLLEVLNFNSNHFMANYLLGLLFYEEKNYEKSRDSLGKILSVGNLSANFLFGKVLLKLNKNMEAIKYFNSFLQFISERKIELKELLSSVFFYLGHAFFKTDNLKKAKNCFKKSLKYKINYWCLNDLAITFIKRNNFFRGNKYLIKSLKIKPDYDAAINNKKELKKIISIQKKYYLSVFLLLIIDIFLVMIKKDNYSIILSVVILLTIITKKLKLGINLAIGEFKFDYHLGEYDFKIDMNLSSWILSIQKE